MLIISAFIVVSRIFDNRFVEDETTKELVSSMNRNFVRFVSHELRSHLNHVCYGLEEFKSTIPMLGDGKQSTNRLAAVVGAMDTLVDDMQDSCDSSLQILNDILLFDTLRNGAAASRREMLELKKIMRSVVEEVEALVSERGLLLHGHAAR